MKLYFSAFVFLMIIFLTDLLFFCYLSKYKNKTTRFLRKLSLYAGLAFFSFLFSLFLLNPKVADIGCANINSHFFYSLTWIIIWYLPRILLFALILLSYIIFFYSRKIREKIIIPMVNIFIFSIIIIIILSVSLGRVVLKERYFNIYNSDIGKSFENYKIVQISDMHLGTMQNSKSLWLSFIKQINAIEPDLIVFTGDLVNNFHTETNGWDSVFSGLKARDGKVAILGNHDYGDYTKWRSLYDRQINHIKVIGFLKRNGFTVLENQNTALVKNNDTLIISGVENWGHHPFPKYGNLKEALRGTTTLPTILLSHDPDHWEAEVSKTHENIFLTLSGHTHGFQFGMRNRYINLSPASLRYKYWGGLYRLQSQYLYVNTGVGFIGFKGRIGIWPEVAVFRLKLK